jgi:hypothetical protein
MANTNGAFGLRPIAKMGQSTNSTGASEYRIAAGNTNAIYQGTPVIPLAAGVIDVVGAAAGGTVGLLGVFWGCEYVSSTTGKKVFSNQWPGSGADTNFPVKAFVYDDPAQMFVIATSNVVAASTPKQKFVRQSLPTPTLLWLRRVLQPLVSRRLRST